MISLMDLAYIISFTFSTNTDVRDIFLVSSSPSPERETRIKSPSVPESENCRANAADLPNPRLASVIKQQGLEPLHNIILQRILIHRLTQSVAKGFCVAR